MNVLQNRIIQKKRNLYYIKAIILSVKPRYWRENKLSSGIGEQPAAFKIILVISYIWAEGMQNEGELTDLI